MCMCACLACARMCVCSRVWLVLTMSMLQDGIGGQICRDSARLEHEGSWWLG